MDNAIYATITRQSGLRNEMQAIANNIANASTDGYRREGLIFSEYVKAMETRDTSLSMARAEARMIDRTQGQLTQTDGQFDFAIDGDGYFMVETPDGPALTRAGHFQPGPDGELVTPEGYRLLDAGQAPIFIAPDATSVGLSADGTLSVDGRAETQLGLFLPADPNDLNRGAGVLFTAEGEIVPAETGRMIQGFLEASNVEPVQEVARMIEVQRAYEQGSRFMTAEDDRIRSVIDTLGR